LVINAISLETEAVLLKSHSQYGGVLTRIAIARASPVGGEAGHMTGWRPAMPVTQWVWVKR
jgi:precorrin-6B C5,15-methyltransferase / cobalt-precorrin-6B C5,C15-methyltransferase